MADNNRITNAIVIGSLLLSGIMIVGSYKGKVLRGVKAGARARINALDLAQYDRRTARKIKRLVVKYERKIARARKIGKVFAIKDAFDQAVERIIS